MLDADRRRKDCPACSDARYLFKRYASGQVRAATEVAKARRGGLLPAPAGACVDCGGDGIEYDHRDYGQPLAVELVCRSCNLRRRSAKPLDWTFDEFMAWFSARCGKRLPCVNPASLQRLRANHFDASGRTFAPLNTGR
jgi:hypothetical protein